MKSIKIMLAGIYITFLNIILILLNEVPDDILWIIFIVGFSFGFIGLIIGNKEKAEKK